MTCHMTCCQGHADGYSGMGMLYFYGMGVEQVHVHNSDILYAQYSYYEHAHAHVPALQSSQASVHVNTISMCGGSLAVRYLHD